MWYAINIFLFSFNKCLNIFLVIDNFFFKLTPEVFKKFRAFKSLEPKVFKLIILKNQVPLTKEVVGLPLHFLSFFLVIIIISYFNFFIKLWQLIILPVLNLFSIVKSFTLKKSFSLLFDIFLFQVNAKHIL